MFYSHSLCLPKQKCLQFLWRIEGKPEPADTNTTTFSDVPPGHNFYKAIQWAAEQGITTGYKDGRFGVNDTCTRGQILMFLWRYAGKPDPKATAARPFSDVPKSHAFYKAILWGSQ
jgi:hypothetical protein